jgi:16S rRNA (guanine1207-N2)-methyltransferase
MDLYFKKQIKYKFRDKTFDFNIANTLFSTFDMDHGTDILLRNIDISNPDINSILDIGCGYGPIGIVMADTFPNAKVKMLDRDLLAVRYSGENVKLNNIQNADVLGSVGMEAVKDEKFDLIISNIPAKIGDEAIEQEFLLDPVNALTEKGRYYFVIVTALNRIIPKLARKHELKLKEVKRRSGHIVYKAYK